MPAGALSTILVCAAGTQTVSPCPAGTAPVATQAYLISPESSGYFEAAVGPYDYSTGSAFWGAAFVFTLGLYLSSRMIGSIVNMTR